MEYNFAHYALSIISGANMAKEEDIISAINSLDKIIPIGYYDDEDGSKLLTNIRDYLKSKLDK